MHIVDLAIERKGRMQAMKKAMQKIIRRITGYFKSIVADELEVMDAFYQQFA